MLISCRILQSFQQHIHAFHRCFRDRCGLLLISVCSDQIKYAIAAKINVDSDIEIKMIRRADKNVREKQHDQRDDNALDYSSLYLFCQSAFLFLLCHCRSPYSDSKHFILI